MPSTFTNINLLAEKDFGHFETSESFYFPRAGVNQKITFSFINVVDSNQAAVVFPDAELSFSPEIGELASVDFYTQGNSTSIKIEDNEQIYATQETIWHLLGVDTLGNVVPIAYDDNDITVTGQLAGYVASQGDGKVSIASTHSGGQLQAGSGTLTVRLPDGSNKSINNIQILEGEAAAIQLIFSDSSPTPAGSEFLAGETYQFELQIVDENGNAVSEGGTFDLTWSATGFVPNAEGKSITIPSSSTCTFDATGRCSTTFNITGYTNLNNNAAKLVSVAAVSTTNSDFFQGQSQFHVTADTFDHYGIEVANATYYPKKDYSTTFNLKLVARDVHGNNTTDGVPSEPIIIEIKKADGGPAPASLNGFSGTLLINGTSGEVNVTGLAFDSTGSYKILATSTSYQTPLDASKTITMLGSMATVKEFKFLDSSSTYTMTAGISSSITVGAYDNNGQLVPTADLDSLAFDLNGPNDSDGSDAPSLTRQSSFLGSGSAIFELSLFKMETLNPGDITISTGTFGQADYLAGTNVDTVQVNAGGVDTYTLRAQQAGTTTEVSGTLDASIHTGLFDVLVKAYDAYKNPTTSEAGLSLVASNPSPATPNSNAFGVLDSSSNNDPTNFTFSGGEHLLSNVYYGVQQQIELNLSTAKTVEREGFSGTLPSLSFLYTHGSVASFDLQRVGSENQAAGLVQIEVRALDKSDNIVTSVDSNLNSERFCWKGPGDSNGGSNPSFSHSASIAFSSGAATFDLNLTKAEALSGILQVYDSFHPSSGPDCSHLSIIPTHSRSGTLDEPLNIISSGSADSLSIEKLSGDPIKAGEGFGIIVKVLDSLGNVVESDTRNISFSLNGQTSIIGSQNPSTTVSAPAIASGTFTSATNAFTFFKAFDGTATITVSDDSTQLASKTLNLSIEPSDKGFVAVHDSFGEQTHSSSFASTGAVTIDTNSSSTTLFARAYDAFGNHIGQESVNWALSNVTGSLTSGDLFGGNSATNTVSLSPSLTGSAKIVATSTTSGVSSFTSVNNLIVELGDPTSFTIINSPVTTMTAGDCLVVEIEFQNSDGLTSPLAANKALTLTDGNGSATGTFHSVSNCSDGANSDPIITQGESSASVYFNATEAGSYTIGISDGITTRNHSLTVEAGPATQLAFTNGAHAFSADDASCKTASFQVQDSFGNPTQLNSAVSLTVKGETSSDLLFYDASCTSPTTTATVTTGTTFTGDSIKFKGAKSGIWNIEVTGGGLSGSFTQAQTVNPGDFTASVLGGDVDNTPSVSWSTSTGAKEFLSQVIASGSSCSTTPAASPVTSTTTASPATGDTFSTLGDGNYKVCIYAKGHSTNGPYHLTSTGALDLKVDTQAPVLSSSVDSITTKDSVNFGISITDHNAASVSTNGNAGVTLAWSILNSPGGSSLSFDASLANPTFSTADEGTYELRLTATDSYGHFDSKDFTFIKDTTKPSNATSVSMGDSSATPNAEIDFDANLYLSWAAIGDANSYTIEIYRGKNCNTPIHTEPNHGTNNFTYGVSKDGTYSFTVQAIDLAGNIANANDCSDGRSGLNAENMIEVETSKIHFSYTRDATSTKNIEIGKYATSLTPTIKTVQAAASAGSLSTLSQLQIGNDNVLHISYAKHEGGGDFESFYESGLFSSAFSTSPVLTIAASGDDIGELNSVAVSSSNEYATVYQDKNGDGPQLSYHINSGSKSTALHESGVTKTLLDVVSAIDSNNDQHIVSVENKGGGSNSLYYSKISQSSGYPDFAHLEVSAIPTDCVEIGPADIAIDRTNDKVHLAYVCAFENGVNNDCRVFYASHAGSSWSTHIEIGTIEDACNESLLTIKDKPRIAIDSSGNPVIAYLDKDIDSLRIKSYSGSSFIDDSELTGHSSNTSNSAGIALAIDKDDQPLILYKKTTNALQLFTKNSGEWKNRSIGGSATDIINVGDLAIEGVKGKSNH